MPRVAGVFLVVFALLTLPAYAGEWTGYISDANCAESRGESPGHAACARSCIERGAAAVLVSGGKVYTLDKQEEAKKFAGEKVVLKGKLGEDGTSIAVDSIAKAQ